MIFPSVDRIDYDEYENAQCWSIVNEYAWGVHNCFQASVDYAWGVEAIVDNSTCCWPPRSQGTTEIVGFEFTENPAGNMGFEKVRLAHGQTSLWWECYIWISAIWSTFIKLRVMMMMSRIVCQHFPGILWPIHSSSCERIFYAHQRGVHFVIEQPMTSVRNSTWNKRQ